MSRRDPDDDWVLPWEQRSDQPREQPARQVEATEPTPYLYGPKGEPLTKQRPLGFRPPTNRSIR